MKSFVMFSSKMFFLIGSFTGSFLFSASSTGGVFTSFVSSSLPAESLSVTTKRQIDDVFLLSNDREKDLLVCALLGSSGEIDDLAQFWQDNVAIFLSNALSEDGDSRALSAIAESIKESFLVGILEPTDFKKTVREELQALQEFPQEYAVALLPRSFSELLEAADLYDEERASISFLFKDKIAEVGRRAALAFAEGCIAQHSHAGDERFVPCDKRIYGLMQAAQAGVVASDPKLIGQAVDKSFYKKMKASLAAMKKSKTGELLFILKDFPLEDGEVECCSICSFDDRALYKNICPCNVSMPLCEPCIRVLTLEKIVGDLRIEFSGRSSGPAHIVFSLQLPRCPYCKRLYYEEKDYVALGNALPRLRRNALIVAALASQLEKFTTEESLVNIIKRLVATNGSYKGIELRTLRGAMLLPQEIALQLFKKDVAMHDAVAEPFTNTDIWKR